TPVAEPRLRNRKPTARRRPPQRSSSIGLCSWFVPHLSKLPHLAVFPKAHFADFAKPQPGIDAQTHAAGGQHGGALVQSLRLLQRGMYERRSDTASSKCFHHVHIVNGGDTRAAAQ